LNAASVFSGASCDAPRCAMMSWPDALGNVNAIKHEKTAKRKNATIGYQISIARKKSAILQGGKHNSETVMHVRLVVACLLPPQISALSPRCNRPAKSSIFGHDLPRTIG
jgi:hypothetical protein